MLSDQGTQKIVLPAAVYIACLKFRVARTSFEAKDAVQNIMTVVKSAVARIPKQWSNVQAVYLKTADSAALPILQQLPDDGVGKIAGGISANDDETILPRDKVKSTKPRAAKSAGTPKKLKGK